MKKANYVALLLCLISATTSNAALVVNDLLGQSINCQEQSVTNALLCGQVSGRLNTLYYSTHDAFFVRDLNQDTATTGGFLKYETAPIAGIQAGISYAGQWRIDDKNADQDEVPELKNDKDGLAEAWLGWKNHDWNLKLGQQALDLPFVGSYDWRVMPPLYRAADVQYGQKDNYIRATYIDRFKSYADD